nr:alpha/beta hydrolase-fold protein [Bacteroidales bacterium]
MHKIFLSLFLLSFATLLSAQENGKVLESVKFRSSVLNQSTEITIYLPPDYETSERNYPVVYLLHGYSDDETAWLQN